MLIGQVAKRTGVSRDTVRFYEQRGLIHSHKRANGYKDYAANTIDSVEFVKLAQELGFSLAEIASFLPIIQSGHLAPELVQSAIAEKITLIDQRIATLQRLRQRLVDLPVGEACPLRRDCS